MDRLHLSKLPKDIIIEILLKVNEYKIYKISIRHYDFIYGEFYVKCRSENELNKMIVSDNIKSTIIKFWKMFFVENDDINIFINSADDITFWHYHNQGPVSLEKEWEVINVSQFDSTVSRLFPQILQVWMESELEGIFITKLDIIS